jgi:hypothetical protein
MPAALIFVTLPAAAAPGADDAFSGRSDVAAYKKADAQKMPIIKTIAIKRLIYDNLLF